MISSSLLICLPRDGGDAGGLVTAILSTRSTLFVAGVCGVSGGVRGTVGCADELTPRVLGAFLQLGDAGAWGGGGAGPFSFLMTPFFSSSALLLLLLLLLLLEFAKFSADSISSLVDRCTIGGNTGAVTVGCGFLTSLCELLLLSLAIAAAAAATGVVDVAVGDELEVELGPTVGICAAAAIGAAGFVLLSSSTGTGVVSFESRDDFDKDVGVSGT